MRNRGAFIHCRDRYMERFGVSLTEEEFHDINDTIISGIAEFVCDVGGGRELWRLRHGRENLCVVFSVDESVAVTFLSNAMAIQRASRLGIDLKPKPLQSRVEQLEAQVSELSRRLEQYKSQQQVVTVDEDFIARIREEAIADIKPVNKIYSVPALREYLEQAIGQSMPEVSAFRKQVNKLAGLNCLPARTNDRGHLEFDKDLIDAWLKRNYDAVRQWQWYAVRP